MKIPTLLVCSTLLSSFGCSATIPTSFESVQASWIEPMTGMEFVSIDPGEFTMGSPPMEVGRESGEYQHQVIHSGQFWIGKTEVTQQQWQIVMGGNPSRFSADEGDLPVETVNWFDAQEFLKRLSDQSGRDRFRLPTEAEWEYVCRAGTNTAFGFGFELSRSQANIAEPGEKPPAPTDQTTAVGSYAPNPWGLHDLHGNVWEWTEDNFCPYPKAPVQDPIGRCQNPLKVIRGGSWLFAADSARCALRYTHQPEDDGPSLGFRVVRETKRE